MIYRNNAYLDFKTENNMTEQYKMMIVFVIAGTLFAAMSMGTCVRINEHADQASVDRERMKMDEAKSEADKAMFESMSHPAKKEF
jgi:hypothetical protein